MKLSKQQPKGNALILSMLIIVVLAGIVAAAQMLSSSQIVLTSRSADIDSMESTAEGLISYAYGVWKDGMTNATTPLSTSDATALVTGSNAPSVPGWMQITSFTITALDKQGLDASSPDAVPSLSQQPKGWQATTYEYAARIILTSTTVTRTPKVVKLEGILRHDLVPPVGGLFYMEGDFELYKPATMTIGGNVHTNANGYVSTNGSLEFLPTSNLSYVGAFAQAAPPGGASWSAVSGPSDIASPTYDRGFANQVSKSDSLEALGAGTAADYSTTDANPNNDGNHELIEPPVAGYVDPPAIASSRIYNNAGLLINIAGPVAGTINLTQTTTGTYSGNNVTITAQNGTTLTKAQATSIVGAISNSQVVNVTTTTTTTDSKGHKTTTTTTTPTTVQATMYDQREQLNVTTSDLDVGSMNSTLNTLSGFNNILYVYNTGTTSAGEAAVRLTDGGVLPTNGLTVATPGGLYVIGDYNTGTTSTPTQVPANLSGNSSGTDSNVVPGYTTKPAALAADAVMILSNNWSDSNASSSVNSRPASNTTINSAIIAGYIPSDWTNPSTGTTYWYSGGANNFTRFLENWSNKTMTFYGAMVSLYQSQTFTGMWDTGNIYSPPTRRWNFDTLLLSRVIPGIPSASVFSLGQVRHM